MFGYKSMARWIAKQRETFKSGKMSEDRKAKLTSIGLKIDGKRRIPHKNAVGAVLGKMPDDDLWFEHDDGVRRRVPPGYVLPPGPLEEVYVMYHCRHRYSEGKEAPLLSPMKLFRPDDMVGKPRDKSSLSEVKLICRIIDRECIRRDVAIDGIMTEEQARKCVRIGYEGLNIPHTTPEDVLKLGWRTAMARKNEGKDKRTGGENLPSIVGELDGALKVEAL